MNFFEDRYAKVDKDLMENGAQVDFGGGFKVTIRHVSSAKVELERGKVISKLKVGNRNKPLSSDQNREVTEQVAARAGIVTWEGGGAPDFTPDVAIGVFKDRPEFLEDVITAMTSYETFREEQIEEAVGNSESSSNGALSLDSTRPRSE